MTKQDIESELTRLGWKTWGTPSVHGPDSYWYKRVSGVVPRCYGNSDKDGLQLCIALWDHSRHTQQNHIGLELILRAENIDARWIEFKFYNLELDNLENELDMLTKRLLAAWGAIND